MRVIFAGGGTAGHINPALAVAKYIMIKQPDSEILFVGTKRGLEKDLVPKSGFPIEYIDVFGFKRKISAVNMIAFVKMFRAYVQSISILKNFKPDIVVGTGGYVSGPLLAAAVTLGYPTLIHEQNVAAGATSKILAKMVDVVCVSFSENKEAFKGAKKIVHTGNPLREELFTISRQEAKKKLGLDCRPFITAFGGSLGAQSLNKAILNLIEKSKERCNFQLLFATGGIDYENVLTEFAKIGITKDNMPNIQLVNYIHNMPEVLNASDLVIARAGAITICELNALGKPSILIPSPNVTGNHQEFNARVLEKAGAAIVFTENELQEDTLYRTVEELLSDQEMLLKMSKNSAQIGIKNGTQKIYDLMEQLIKEKAN